MTDARLRCQEQCDLVNDLHISPAEWYRYMSRAYGELYSIVSSTGMRYFETVYSITTTGAVSYQEPTSHFETVSMCEVVDTVAGRRRNLREAMEQERSSLMGQTGPAAFYALIDDQLFLYPTPPAGATYEMCYVPQPPDLNTYGDTDIIDVVTPDGEAFFTWGVAVMALAKSESSTDLALQELDANSRTIAGLTGTDITVPAGTTISGYPAS